MKHVEYIKATPLLIDTLLEAYVKTHDYIRDGLNQYAISFAGDRLEMVKAAVNNSNARFHKVGKRYRFYSMEVWSDLRGEPRTRPSYDHDDEPTNKRKRSTTHCCGALLQSHTFTDGQTIKLCRVCGVHFTTIIELPLRSNDRHRREVLCGVNG